MDKKAKKEAKRLEKLREEAEARKRMKREELEREIAAQAKRRKSLDKSWRQMMLTIKEPVFRQEIEVMWHVFERVYDKKDTLIQHTINLMNTADDQFQRTIASFCVTIDTMINKFLADLEALSNENDRRTAELLKRGEDDADRIISDHNAAETHLQLLLYHAHTTADNIAWTTRGENIVKEEEDRKKYASDRENLRSFLENVYNVTWDEYKAVLKEYVVGTAENQKQVRKLRKKEAVMSDIIASQAKKIANSDGLLKRLRLELAAYESGTKQAIFRDRRDRYRAAFLRMKKSMTDGCAFDAKQLELLVKSSDDTIAWLFEAHKKGEKILRLAALCRKFETRREKVLPYGSMMPHSSTQVKTNVRRQTSDDSLVSNAISSTCGLTRLWQRIAKAELTRRALLREKTLLEEENAYIMQKLQAYRDAQTICVETDKICKCKPTKKGSMPTAPTAIEGVLEVNKIEILKVPTLPSTRDFVDKSPYNLISTQCLNQNFD